MDYEIKKKSVKHKKPDIWKYKEQQSKAFIEEFKNESEADILFPAKYTGFVFIGDLHLGDKGTDHERARQDAELIAKTPNCYAMLNGDYVDNFIKTKIISAIVNKDISPSEEFELLERYLEFLNGSAVLAISGNHDSWQKELCGIDHFKTAFLKQDVLYARDEFRLNACIGKQMYKIGMRHKYKYNSNSED